MNKNIILKLNTKVEDASLGEGGEKIVRYLSRGKARTRKFNYVINATYANHNTFCGWLGFPKKDLRIQLRELILLKLPTLRNIAVTVINGPFESLLPFRRITSKNQLFTLGDALLATHKEPKNYSDKEFRTFKRGSRTKWRQMQKHCLRWTPILKSAQYKQSMFTVLATDVISKKLDNRPTYVTRHGFGCYSVLAGKIITSVNTAQEILQDIKTQKI